MPDGPREPEVLDGLPVVAPPPAAGLPVPARSRQAAALAATGFVAGATAMAVLGRRGRARALSGRRRLLPGRRRRPKGLVGEIVGSNAFLVEVHLLRRD